MLNGILFFIVDIVRRLVNHLLKNVYFLCDNNIQTLEFSVFSLSYPSPYLCSELILNCQLSIINLQRYGYNKSHIAHQCPPRRDAGGQHYAGIARCSPAKYRQCTWLCCKRSYRATARAVATGHFLA